MKPVTRRRLEQIELLDSLYIWLLRSVLRIALSVVAHSLVPALLMFRIVLRVLLVVVVALALTAAVEGIVVEFFAVGRAVLVLAEQSHGFLEESLVDPAFFLIGGRRCDDRVRGYFTPVAGGEIVDGLARAVATEELVLVFRHGIYRKRNVLLYNLDFTRMVYLLLVRA